MTETIRAKLLIGWMSEAEAVDLLMNECVFDKPLTRAEAVQIHQTYVAKVIALEPRPALAPENKALTFGEKNAVNNLIKRAKKNGGAHIKGWKKIDPLGLVVHQLFVALGVAEKYASEMGNPQRACRKTLGLGAPIPQYKESRQGNILIIDLPHGEFNLGYDPKTNQYIVQENARWTTVHAFGDRLLLWAGYHRTYALLSNQTYPEDTERLLLSVLTTEAERLLGAASDRPDRRTWLLGERPPLFADFFDEDLCMTVVLRKGFWRFEVNTTTRQARKLWIHSS
jgi:hypothetical protein